MVYSSNGRGNCLHRLSIIVPTKNGARASALVNGLRTTFNDAEIIAIDKSNALSNELAAMCELVIGQQSDGYENAPMAGFRQAYGDSTTTQYGNKVLAGPSNWPCLTKMHGVLGGSFAMNKQAFDAMDGGARNRAGTVFFEIGLANCHMVIKDIPIS